MKTYPKMNAQICDLLLWAGTPGAHYAATRIQELEQAIRDVACECSCREGHGAEGGEHLTAIKEMLLSKLNL